MEYPFFRTVFNRRSRRICKGISAVNAGSHSYHSQEQPQPLSPLEEAMLIAVTGVTLGHGGALSHHHGVGINRSRYVHDALGPGASDLLLSIKSALDPAGILNPGKFGFPSPWGPLSWP